LEQLGTLHSFCVPYPVLVVVVIIIIIIIITTTTTTTTHLYIALRSEYTEALGTKTVSIKTRFKTETKNKIKQFCIKD